MSALYRGFSFVAACALACAAVAVEVRHLTVRRPGVTEVEHYR